MLNSRLLKRLRDDETRITTELLFSLLDHGKPSSDHATAVLELYEQSTQHEVYGSRLKRLLVSLAGVYPPALQVHRSVWNKDDAATYAYISENPDQVKSFVMRLVRDIDQALALPA